MTDRGTATTNPWVALRPGEDAVAHARAVLRAHGTIIGASGGRRPDGVRPVVHDSCSGACEEESTPIWSRSRPCSQATNSSSTVSAIRWR